MAESRYVGLYGKIDKALKEVPKRSALYNAMKRGRDSRHAAIGVLRGGESFRDRVRETKLRCLEQQDDLQVDQQIGQAIN